MQEPQTFNWLQYVPPSARPVDIKVEPSYLEPSFSLISPPSSPSFARSVPNTSALPCTPRRRSNSSLTSPKRAKPYPSSPRETRLRAEESAKMTNPSYGTWSPSSSATKGGHVRPNLSAERRSSDVGPHHQYPLSSAFPFHHTYESRTPAHMDQRPQSSSSSSNMTTSSLTGAMGDAHVTSRSRTSASPPPRGDHPYGVNVATGMDWASSSHQQHSQTQPMLINTAHDSYAGPPSHGNIDMHSLSPPTPLPGSSGQYVQYQEYNSSTYHNQSPESVSPPSPAFGSSSYHAANYAFQPSRDQPPMPGRPSGPNHYTANCVPLASPSPSSSSSPRSSAQDQFEQEIHHLRKRVRELELVNESGRQRVQELEMELANEIPYTQPINASASSSTHVMGGLPSPLATPSPQSANFQASWKARTDARVRQFCSLNRAGNALCAWHDSRRERRAWPPRMAPAGHLNCGCTYEEALFEESLARHGVGSYHPGENVRMDPALRNPLLKLLQDRYGYNDGDFERDPISGDWLPGEGHTYWEQRAQVGSNSRKIRGDSDRR